MTLVDHGIREAQPTFPLLSSTLEKAKVRSLFPVELTLIPLTALLLFLAGAAAPRQEVLGELAGTACIRFWFALEQGGGSATMRARTARQLAPAGTLCRRLGAFQVSRQRLSRRVRALGDALRLRQFKTRFGIAGGAYLPMAPPIAG